MDLIQGSPEWLEWRMSGVGASEIPAIIGVCEYNTINGTWRVKTRRSRGFEGNSATQHGQETEAKARARYELITMNDVKPACATHPKYKTCIASLDGISEDGKLVVEIKCPKGRDTIDTALAGNVPPQYWPQCQYQLAVTGADELHFFVYHEGSGEHALVTVKPDLEYQGTLIAAALDFWERYVLADVPPPLTDRDVKIIDDDPILKEVCGTILRGKDSMKKKDLDFLKAEAIAMAGHPKMLCGGVQISTVNRNGVFSYHKLTIKEEAQS